MISFFNCSAQITINEIKQFLINDGYKWRLVERDVFYFAPPPKTWYQFLDKEDKFFVKITEGYYSNEKVKDVVLADIIVINPYDIVIRIGTQPYYLIFDLKKTETIILRVKGNSPESPTWDLRLFNERGLEKWR